MKATIEKVSHQDNFGCRIRLYNCSEAIFDWHYHFEYELVLHRHLSGKKFVGQYIGAVEHNNLALYGPKLPHTVIHDESSNNQDNCTYIIWFSHSWISKVIEIHPELNSLKLLLQNSLQGIEYHEALAEQVFQLIKDQHNFSPALIVSRVIEVLIRLAECKQFKTLNNYNKTIIEDDPKEIKQIQKITHYIEQNYRNNIQIIDICAHIHVSESTVYRLFERHFISSFSNFVNEFRLGKACELLINSNSSIATISDLVGFNNTSNFNRQFKNKKQMTPKQFRKLFN
ncbi:MAG: helix-turn-helix transcriptional regulator [Alteromonadales bacterium]|nr:helix-turn-helix transcriptional regulator [Alteromonadales bacterium]